MFGKLCAKTRDIYPGIFENSHLRFILLKKSIFSDSPSSVAPTERHIRMNGGKFVLPASGADPESKLTVSEWAPQGWILRRRRELPGGNILEKRTLKTPLAAIWSSNFMKKCIKVTNPLLSHPALGLAMAARQVLLRWWGKTITGENHIKYHWCTIYNHIHILSAYKGAIVSYTQTLVKYEEDRLCEF